MKNSFLHKQKNKVFILLLLLISSSCGKNFLNLAPELWLPEEDSFNTKDRIEAQVTGLYATLKDGNFYAGRYQIYNDIRGEEFSNRTSNVVTGFSTYQFSNDPSDTYIAAFWSHGYLTINRVNKFIADFETAPEGVVTAEEKQSFIAEAKFVRALAYYSLVQLFAKPYALNDGTESGIPLRLQAETGIGNNNLPTSSVGEIYTQILADLDAAETDLPETIASANARTTRAHRNTAIALKTRVFLAMRDYTNVIASGNQLVTQSAPFTAIAGVPHQLNPNVAELYTAYNTLENILSWPYSSTNAPGTQNQLGFYYNLGNIEYFLNANAPGIYASAAWPSSDARKENLTALTDGFNLLTKWGPAPYLDWVPVIRYAEVLLNLAEAEAESGSETRALALLQAVRQRSDANYSFPVFASKAELVEAILLERRIELLGEGFRAPDLQRRLDPLPAIGLGTPVPYTDDRYTFPIPTDEIQINQIR